MGNKPSWSGSSDQFHHECDMRALQAENERLRSNLLNAAGIDLGDTMGHLVRIKELECELDSAVRLLTALVFQCNGEVIVKQKNIIANRMRLIREDIDGDVHLRTKP